MGWMPVTDQRPVTKKRKDGTKMVTWVPVDVPVRGIRFCEMDDGVGYLAVKTDATRRLYEGVPKHVYEVLLKHRAASSYLRRYVWNVYLPDMLTKKYPCVEEICYEPKTPYIPKEKPPRKNLKPVKEVPDQPPAPQMSLFLLLDLKTKRRGK